MYFLLDPQGKEHKHFRCRQTQHCTVCPLDQCGFTTIHLTACQASLFEWTTLIEVTATVCFEDFMGCCEVIMTLDNGQRFLMPHYNLLLVILVVTCNYFLSVSYSLPYDVVLVFKLPFSMSLHVMLWQHVSSYLFPHFVFLLHPEASFLSLHKKL